MALTVHTYLIIGERQRQNLGDWAYEQINEF